MTPETITRLAEERPSLVEQLEQYVDNWNTREFADLVRATEWSERPPEELVEAISFSVSLEMPRLARELTALGKRLFPENERIQHYAYVLAPPTARIVEGSVPTTSLRDSMAWLSKNYQPYRNQWVAVRDGKLLGVASSLEELAANVSLDKLTLVTQVL